MFQIHNSTRLTCFRKLLLILHLCAYKTFEKLSCHQHKLQNTLINNFYLFFEEVALEPIECNKRFLCTWLKASSVSRAYLRQSSTESLMALIIFGKRRFTSDILPWMHVCTNFELRLNVQVTPKSQCRIQWGGALPT